jgi:superfamily II DNA or RNA helicase
LSSVEDDGFGEELTVFWEVEPGTVVLPKATLPRPEPGCFDDPDRLAAFLDAVRWGAIASADASALQAPFRSGITIEDYQLDPVVRALQMPRVNLMIADDVGLGKTIEAGLVIQELLLRHRAHTVLVVCPASLCLKWQGEMLDRFGLEFRIVDSDAVKQLRRERGVAANVWTHFPRLIVSLDWLKGPRAMALLDEVLPQDASVYPRRFDLLVIDEVHQCAPAGRGVYATDSLRTKAIKQVAPHFEHRLFLSATPHNGYTESFTALLELLDPQRFKRTVAPSQEALKRAIVRRMKSELRKELPPREDGTPRFARRDILPLEVAYPAEERRVHELLQEYTESRRKQARSRGSETAMDFVTILLKKRLFSSPRAFHETLQQHLKTLRRNCAAEQVTEKQLRAAFDRLDEDIEDEEALDERAAEALTSAARVLEPVSKQQEQLLGEMLAWAAREAHRADAKAGVLIDWLGRTCRPGGVWNDERVIVFTEYRDTQNWLQQLLAQQGFGGDRIALLYGGMDTDKRERVKAEFQAPPDRSDVRILLATDAASEGIDLQLQCHRLVHVEIPFSPSRLEQRNGRVDRHGQPSPVVEIFHFVGKGYQDASPGSLEGDLDFLSRIARKVETIRDDLGTAGPVLAVQVEEAMLGRRRTVDEQPLREAKDRASRTALRLKRNLREEITRLRERLDRSIEELGINPAAAERVVSTGLALARQPALRPAPSRPGCFHVGQLTNAWALGKVGLRDPLTDVERPITFDHAIASRDRDVVLAHLGHHLVGQATRLLRAEIWKTGGEKTLHRVSACVAKDGSLTEAAVIAHARLVLTGADGHRLHEEIIAAGGYVRNGRFMRLNVGQVRDAIAAAGPHPVDAATQRDLSSGWTAIETPLFRALEARADGVVESLERRLQERAADDVRTVEAVLTELAKNIEAQIARFEGDEGRQLKLQFREEEESAQFELDLDDLRARLRLIPAEIVREQDAIRRRYKEPKARLFPAAVTIVVPAGARAR